MRPKKKKYKRGLWGEKQAAYLRSWFAKNPDRRKEYQRAYFATHAPDREKLRQYNAEAQRQLRTREPELAALLQRVRRCGSSLTLAQGRKLLQQYGVDYPKVCGLNEYGKEWLRHEKALSPKEDYGWLRLEAWRYASHRAPKKGISAARRENQSATAS